ncbi:TolC family protein [Gramella sp. GC03-9]|uniref:TolC family protein n=1 Tax=Christiangramia oceanisediminis TaxID=2920386 RepID=A0A9X2IBD7_9FLAO|nr:TolC family protein [Gramella oceanisediminis]MCP9199773.1 TolC family protein [Gramella oceanisediminis]
MRHLKIFLLLILTCPLFMKAQVQDSTYLGFEEYLNLVKTYHPVVKQAGLITERADANLRSSRGNFDPKIEAGYDRKDYKETEYYDLLNTSFKIPTWFGVELKAQYENNSGVYLNPQNTVPEDGLFAAGISVPVGQGLFINERMATLKQAKVFVRQSEAEQQIAVNDILYRASQAYFDWFSSYLEMELLEGFLENAQIRFRGVVRSYQAGDKPAIDTTEAKLNIQNRRLSLEQARLDYIKNSLQLSTFLWNQDNEPLELREQTYPAPASIGQVDEILDIQAPSTLEEHPVIRSLNYKIEILELEQRLKANKLLPKINLEYNFLTEEATEFNSLNYDNYKFGVNFSFPLFLRKERGELKLAKLKVENADFDLVNKRIELQNKILALREQVNSLREQTIIMEELIDSYERMLEGEVRKFDLGESSIFLINTRESSLLSALQKEIQLQNKLLNSKAELFRILATIPQI